MFGFLILGPWLCGDRSGDREAGSERGSEGAEQEGKARDGRRSSGEERTGAGRKSKPAEGRKGDVRRTCLRAAQAPRISTTSLTGASQALLHVRQRRVSTSAQLGSAICSEI